MKKILFVLSAFVAALALNSMAHADQGVAEGQVPEVQCNGTDPRAEGEYVVQIYDDVRDPSRDGADKIAELIWFNARTRQEKTLAVIPVRKAFDPDRNEVYSGDGFELKIYAGWIIFENTWRSSLRLKGEPARPMREVHCHYVR